MDARESERLFKQADELFKAGQYQQALQALSQLNQAYPNTRNILYPIALCLRHLGRTEEAVAISTQLVQQFQDPRAEQLLHQLQPRQAPQFAAGPDFSNLDDLLEPRRPATPPPVPQRGGLDTELLLIIGGLVVAGVVLMVLSAYVQAQTMTRVTSMFSAMNEGGEFDFSQFFGGSFALSLLVQTLLGVVLTVPALYLSLMIFGHLPENDLREDLKNILVAALIYNVLAVTCIGIIFIPFFLAKRYEVSFGRGWLLFIVALVINFGLGMLVGSVTGAMSVMFMPPPQPV